MSSVRGVGDPFHLGGTFQTCPKFPSLAQIYITHTLQFHSNMLVSVDLHMHVIRPEGKKVKDVLMPAVVDDEVVDRGRSIMDCGSGAFRAPQWGSGRSPESSCNVELTKQNCG